MDNQNMIDDIVSMLDNSAANGVGHMNVTVNAADGDALEKNVETMGCTDCAKGDLACSVPTLHEGVEE